jgi:hypothetical protein
MSKMTDEEIVISIPNTDEEMDIETDTEDEDNGVTLKSLQHKDNDDEDEIFVTISDTDEELTDTDYDTETENEDNGFAIFPLHNKDDEKINDDDATDTEDENDDAEICGSVYQMDRMKDGIYVESTADMKQVDLFNNRIIDSVYLKNVSGNIVPNKTLPQNLKNLTIEHHGVYNVDPSVLPSTLETLTLIGKYVRLLPNLPVPSTLQVFYLNCNTANANKFYIIDHSADVNQINLYDNNIINSVYFKNNPGSIIPNRTLPKKLNHLTIEADDGMVNPQILPENLKSITLVGKNLRFSTTDPFPKSLKKLEVNHIVQ